MQTRFAEHANFLTVYIKEAHPEDEWQMRPNEKEGVCYKQPTTLEERIAIARDFVERTSYEIPIAVDAMDNAAEVAFAGWPERLYVIDEAGAVAYKGGMGPTCFDPPELEAWLAARFEGS
jgi:hypothetical protein